MFFVNDCSKKIPFQKVHFNFLFLKIYKKYSFQILKKNPYLHDVSPLIPILGDIFYCPLSMHLRLLYIPYRYEDSNINSNNYFTNDHRKIIKIILVNQLQKVSNKAL